MKLGKSNSVDLNRERIHSKTPVSTKDGMEWNAASGELIKTYHPPTKLTQRVFLQRPNLLALCFRQQTYIAMQTTLGLKQQSLQVLCFFRLVICAYTCALQDRTRATRGLRRAPDCVLEYLKTHWSQFSILLIITSFRRKLNRPLHMFKFTNKSIHLVATVHSTTKVIWQEDGSGCSYNCQMND
jgi:hypothetical protein